MARKSSIIARKPGMNRASRPNSPSSASNSAHTASAAECGAGQAREGEAAWFMSL